MWFALYAVISIAVIVLHYTGILARYNLEWLVLVLAATVIPAILWL